MGRQVAVWMCRIQETIQRNWPKAERACTPPARAVSGTTCLRVRSKGGCPRLESPGSTETPKGKKRQPSGKARRISRISEPARRARNRVSEPGDAENEVGRLAIKRKALYLPAVPRHQGARSFPRPSNNRRSRNRAEECSVSSSPATPPPLKQDLKKKRKNKSTTPPLSGVSNRQETTGRLPSPDWRVSWPAAGGEERCTGRG